MIYKQFHDLQISQLGMGAMRLPTIGERGPIDEDKAREIIEYAYEHGVNYFDTAYRYHNGESEKFLGKVLSQYPRESWYLASKMPGHMMRFNNGRLEFSGYLAGLPLATPAEIFEEQLDKCGVDYFDFYLLHNVCETSLDIYMNEELGILDYLLEQKKKGKIRYLGFSTHAMPETLERFLSWRDCFDFVQIQLNYMDWTLQNAKRKYEILAERGIPVIVMEPCRGGRLASLNEEANAMLKQARPSDSIASWAFRFVKSLPGVLVVLSGMTKLDQVIDNIKTFSDPTPLTEEENELLLKKVMSTLVHLVPCTACRYCCDGCPQNLDIPKLISIYNEVAFEPSPAVHFAIAALKDDEKPSNCIACGKCKEICPQGIDVPEIMKKFSEALEKMPRFGPPRRR